MSNICTIDEETDQLLDQLATSSGKPRGVVVREALTAFATKQQVQADEDRPYALVSDLLGSGSGGPSDLARRHKQAFRDLLRNGCSD